MSKGPKAKPKKTGKAGKTRAKAGTAKAKATAAVTPAPATPTPDTAVLEPSAPEREDAPRAETPTREAARSASNGAIVRLRAEIWRQKRHVVAVERERDRLVRQLERQHKLMDLECALRARLQDQIDCLCDRLATALPEAVGNPAAGADILWKRLERQVERLGEDPP